MEIDYLARFKGRTGVRKSETKIHLRLNDLAEVLGITKRHLNRLRSEGKLNIDCVVTETVCGRRTTSPDYKQNLINLITYMNENSKI